MAHKKACTASQALALLNSMDYCESDGGEGFCFGAADDSDFDLHFEHSTDEDASDSADEENYSPPRKKRLGTQEGSIPAPSVKAKDGTVWEKISVERLHGRKSHTNVSFWETAGPTEHVKDTILSRLQSFLCLFDTEMLMIITDCTVHEAHRTDPSWSFSVTELMAFIAILFLRATLCPIGAMIESWSEKYAVPTIKETMSRDRYKDIMRHLRFDDKDTRAKRVKTDRFAAISNIWERLIHNCQLCYKPGQHMSVHEELYPTKVRCPFLQYRGTHKFGIKFWLATDLETKYVCNAAPYLGKDPTCPKAEKPPEDVVMKLTEPFLGTGRTFTMDDKFTSLALADRLLECNTTLLGNISTIRKEIPAPAKNAKGREEFSTLAYKSGSATLTTYIPKKNKSLCILSTVHQHVQIVEGRKHKPNTITDYNRMKCAIDAPDQKAHAYTVRAATRRWPVAVFYNMLDLAATNAYVLYKACTGSTERKRDFIHGLAEDLRRGFLLEKEMIKMQRPPLASGKKTQCQVQANCHRNVSTQQCEICNRYTCRKCRKERPWVCSNC